MTDLNITVSDIRIQRGAGAPTSLERGEPDLDETANVLRVGKLGGMAVFRDQGYVDSGDAATLSAAQSYANAGNASTLAAAKAYTDAHGGGGGGTVTSTDFGTY